MLAQTVTRTEAKGWVVDAMLAHFSDLVAHRPTTWMPASGHLPFHSKDSDRICSCSAAHPQISIIVMKEQSIPKLALSFAHAIPGVSQVNL